MEDWQKNCIQNNLSDLIKYIKCSSLLVAELSTTVLSEDNQAALKAEKNEFLQTEYLLKELKTKRNGYKALLNALNETYQSGARDILMIGLLCNLRIQISSRHSLLKEHLPEIEIRTFYRELSQTEFDTLYPYLITFLETDQPVKLVKENIPKKLSYYIPRILSKRLRLNPDIFKQICEDTFVVSGVGRNTLKNLAGQNKTAYSSDQLDDITANIIILEDFGDWEELKELKSPIHLIEYEAEQQKFILKESKGTSNTIFRFLDRTKEEYDVTIKEEQFMNDMEKEKCKGVCICDLPGMGKTLLIENLARRAELQNKSIVVYVRLQHFTQTVHECFLNATPMQVLLQYISSKCGVLSVLVMRKIVETEQIKLDVFFDGFDEVSENYFQLTKDFLKSLIRHNNIRVFVTSRPHMRLELQDTLGVIAYDILPFDQTDEINFFTNFWLEKNLRQDPSKLKAFANICRKEFNANSSKDEHDIAGKPLICLLIAEIYAKQASRYARKNIHVSENLSAVGKTMFGIYQKFIDTKFEIRKDSDQSLRNVANIRKEHYRKALIQLYPDCAQKPIENVYSANEDIKHLLSYGLIHEIHNGETITFQFIHRTIAEFLVAEYATDQLMRISDCDNKQTDITISDVTKPRTIQVKKFVKFLFKELLITQKVDNGWGESISITQGIMPQTYYFTFSASTAMYFMEHLLKPNVLPKNTYVKVLRTMNSSMIRVYLIQLIESCGIQNLVNVFCFIENVLLLSPDIEVISKESLCKTISVICQFSKPEFVNKCVEFVDSYFSFSIKEIVEVCTKNRWVTPLQYACYRKSFDLLDYFLELPCYTENQCLVHYCVGNFRRHAISLDSKTTTSPRYFTSEFR